MRASRRPTPVIGLLLLAAALDLVLLRPFLSQVSLAPNQTRRAYFEPLPDGTVLMLDEAHDGYITDVQLDGRGDLAIPAGRTIAIPLQHGTEITVRTLAADLAPYIVLGSGMAASGSAGVGPLGGAVVPIPRAGHLEPQPWDASRPWGKDKEWLRQLDVQCSLGPQAEVSIRSGAGGFSIATGTCTGTVRVGDDASSPPLVAVVTGPHAAVVSRTGTGWQWTREVHWGFVALILVRIGLLGFAVGAGPTALASGVACATGLFWWSAAILAWSATLPIVGAAAAARAVAWIAPRRRSLAWAGGVAVLALEIGGIVAAVAFLDIGTFGHERMTREGDGACSLVGYSTVRGDSLRYGTGGIVERLNADCAPCRGRTARFSREAQTLRWVRQEVCSPAFPVPAGGDIVFLGGGNDDLFYRPTGLLARLGVFAGMLRFVVQPVAATDWQVTFDQGNQSIVATLDDQAADIEAIARCASAGGRRFFFLHDFLSWDLDGGRTPVRQHTLSRRRAAVLSAGGDFVDLLDEFRQSAGVSWFNDFIHPSAVGQRMIADLLCARLASDRRSANSATGS